MGTLMERIFEFRVKTETSTWNEILISCQNSIYLFKKISLITFNIRSETQIRFYITYRRVEKLSYTNCEKRRIVENDGSESSSMSSSIRVTLLYSHTFYNANKWLYVHVYLQHAEIQPEIFTHAIHFSVCAWLGSILARLSRFSDHLHNCVWTSINPRKRRFLIDDELRKCGELLMSV